MEPPSPNHDSASARPADGATATLAAVQEAALSRALLANAEFADNAGGAGSRVGTSARYLALAGALETARKTDAEDTAPVAAVLTSVLAHRCVDSAVGDVPAFPASPDGPSLTTVHRTDPLAVGAALAHRRRDLSVAKAAHLVDVPVVAVESALDEMED